MSHRLAPVAALGLAALFTAPGLAQCLTQDFENLPLGTVVTTQYPGVTFDAVPDTCGGGIDVFVANPPGGVSSGTRCLSLEWGCPDFSDDFLVMRFDEGQAYVTFTVGTTIGVDVTVRAYSAQFGGALLSTRIIGTSDMVNGLVRIGSPGGPSNVRRIEVEAASSDLERIDDLSYEWDQTMPIASITSPSFRECFCGDAFIPVVGEACDPDGAYGNDRLEWRAAGADESDPWNLVGSFASPLCGGGTLYVVDASTLPAGHVYLRLTVTNACGLTDTAITVVRIDRSPPGIAIDMPAENAFACGQIDICGALSDACPMSWTLVAKPLVGGPDIPIAEGEGGACGLIAQWNAAGVAPGGYDLVLDAVDSCGQMSSLSRQIFVNLECNDADLDGDGEVGFSDLLLVLTAWGT